MFNVLVLNLIPSGLFLNTPLSFIATILHLRFHSSDNTFCNLLVVTLCSIDGYHFLRKINCFTLQHSMEAAFPAICS